MKELLNFCTLHDHALVIYQIKVRTLKHDVYSEFANHFA